MGPQGLPSREKTNSITLLMKMHAPSRPSGQTIVLGATALFLRRTVRLAGAEREKTGSGAQAAVGNAESFR